MRYKINKINFRSNEPDKEVKSKSVNLKQSELKAVSIPSTTLDSIPSTSSTLSLSSLLKEAKKEKSTQCTVQSIDRSTDMRDLHQPKVSKSSTTSDLIRFNQVGVNTDPPPIVPLRSISTNTSTTIMKSVGTATDDSLMEKLRNENTTTVLAAVFENIKLPAPLPTIPENRENRHLKRQDTFTVSMIPVATSTRTNVAECPAEKLLR